MIWYVINGTSFNFISHSYLILNFLIILRFINFNNKRGTWLYYRKKKSWIIKTLFKSLYRNSYFFICFSPVLSLIWLIWIQSGKILSSVILNDSEVLQIGQLGFCFIQSWMQSLWKTCKGLQISFTHSLSDPKLSNQMVHC